MKHIHCSLLSSLAFSRVQNVSNDFSCQWCKASLNVPILLRCSGLGLRRSLASDFKSTAEIRHHLFSGLYGISPPSVTTHRAWFTWAGTGDDQWDVRVNLTHDISDHRAGQSRWAKRAGLISQNLKNCTLCDPIEGTKRICQSSVSMCPLQQSLGTSKHKSCSFLSNV